MIINVLFTEKKGNCYSINVTHPIHVYQQGPDETVTITKIVRYIRIGARPVLTVTTRVATKNWIQRRAAAGRDRTTKRFTPAQELQIYECNSEEWPAMANEDTPQPQDRLNIKLYNII